MLCSSFMSTSRLLHVFSDNLLCFILFIFSKKGSGGCLPFAFFTLIGLTYSASSCLTIFFVLSVLTRLAISSIESFITVTLSTVTFYDSTLWLLLYSNSSSMLLKRVSIGSIGQFSTSSQSRSSTLLNELGFLFLSSLS